MSAVDHAAMRAAAEGATAAGFMYDDDYIAAAYPAAVLALLDENARLRKALAGISLATQRNDSPAHIIVQQVGREARAALEPRS